MIKTTFLVNFTLKTHFFAIIYIDIFITYADVFFRHDISNRPPCVLGYLTHMFKNISHTLSQNYATT